MGLGLGLGLGLAHVSEARRAHGADVEDAAVEVEHEARERLAGDVCRARSG